MTSLILDTIFLLKDTKFHSILPVFFFLLVLYLFHTNCSKVVLPCCASQLIFILTSVRTLYLPLLNLILSTWTHLFNLRRPCQIQCFSPLSRIDLIQKYHEVWSSVFSPKSWRSLSSHF